MSKRTRKARKRDITLAGGQTAAPRPVNRGRPPQEDATKTAIDARLRMVGKPDTEANRAAMRSQMQGCAIGRALASRAGDDMPDLWGAVQHIRRTDYAYRRSIGLPSPHAKVAGILAPTEAMETSADAPPADLRTVEEKARAATAAHMAVQGWLGYTDKHAGSCVKAATIFTPDEPIRDLPSVIRALQCVVDGIKGNRMIWRGATAS